MSLFPRIFHYVHAKLHNISRADFIRFTLIACLAESLIVDKCSITAAGIFDEEFAFIIPQLGMISRENFTIKNGVRIRDFGACNGSAYFNYFVGFQQKGAGLWIEL